MTNLFPLPYWAPAFKRVPIPLQLLDQAFMCGDRFINSASARDCPGIASSFAPFAAPLSGHGEDVSRSRPADRGEGHHQ
jgi:hypothetical protein